MAYIFMACIVMACIVMAYVIMAYTVMAYTVMAYKGMAYIVGTCRALLARVSDVTTACRSAVPTARTLEPSSDPACHNYIGP